MEGTIQVVIDDDSYANETTIYDTDGDWRFRLRGYNLCATGAAGQFVFRDDTAGTVIHEVQLPLDVPVEVDLGIYGIGSAARGNALTGQLVGGNQVTGTVYLDRDVDPA